MNFPRQEAELIVWFNNFAANLATHAPALGFDESVVEGVRRDAAALKYTVGNLVPAYQTALQARTAYKKLLLNGPAGREPLELPAAPPVAAPPEAVPPGILPRTRRLIARIKAADAYTESIGRSLGIVRSAATAAALSAAAPRPSAKATPLPGGEVRVEFGRAGFDGVLVEGRRGGEAGWERLGVDSYSPYTDARPPLTPGQPEVRQYRLRFVKRDDPVGDWSDIVSVTATP